jgi:hypothetical protein
VKDSDLDGIVPTPGTAILDRILNYNNEPKKIFHNFALKFVRVQKMIKKIQNPPEFDLFSHR